MTLGLSFFICKMEDCVPAKLIQLCQLCVTPWTVAHQAPLSMGFSRQEYWSGLQFPTPGGLPASRIEPKSPASPALQAGTLLLSHQGSPLGSREKENQMTLDNDIFLAGQVFQERNSRVNSGTYLN